MVLLDPMAQPQPIRYFDTRATCLNHMTTIKKGYSSTVHIGSVIQTAEVVQMSKEVFRSEDTALIRWRFKENTEFIKEGSTILMRDGRTKMIGVVSRVYFEEEEEQQQSGCMTIIDEENKNITM